MLASLLDESLSIWSKIFNKIHATDTCILFVNQKGCLQFDCPRSFESLVNRMLIYDIKILDFFLFKICISS